MQVHGCEAMVASYDRSTVGPTVYVVINSLWDVYPFHLWESSWPSALRRAKKDHQPTVPLRLGPVSSELTVSMTPPRTRGGWLPGPRTPRPCSSAWLSMRRLTCSSTMWWSRSETSLGAGAWRPVASSRRFGLGMRGLASAQTFF